jgi:hypothetical protein
MGRIGGNNRYLVKFLSPEHQHPTTKIRKSIGSGTFAECRQGMQRLRTRRPSLRAYRWDEQPAMLRSLIKALKGAWNGSRPILEDRLCCGGRESPVLRSAGAVSAPGRPAPSLSFRLGIGRGFLGVPSPLRSIGIIFSRSEEIIIARHMNRIECPAVDAKQPGRSRPQFPR